MTEPLKLVTAGTDVEAAAEIKKKVLAVMGPMLEVLGDAKKQGFDVNFSIAPGPLGMPVLQALKVTKEF